MEELTSCAMRIDSSHIPEFEVQLGVKVTLTVLYGLLLAAGLLGNMVTIRVCTVLRARGYLQPPVSRHMVSLACSDLLLLLMGLPVELIWGVWLPFSSSPGDMACKLYYFLLEACSYATILHVATLSLERYTAICHPFRFHAMSTSKTTYLLIGLAWLSSLCVAVPLLFTMGSEYPLTPATGRYSNCSRLPPNFSKVTPNITLCTSLSNRWPAFQASVFSAFCIYILVLGAVAFMCRKMMVILMSAKKGTVTVKGNSGASEMTKNSSDEAKTARKQTILFLGLIVATLALCWMPNQILRIMAASVPKQEWSVGYLRTYMTLLPIADTFFYLSSVLNPILYNISSKQFRDVFLQVLRCRLTIEHVNRVKFQHIQSSAKSSTGHKRPLILKSFRHSYSSNSATEKPSHRLQAEPSPGHTTHGPVPATLYKEVQLQTETSKNGLCESEI